MSKKEKKMKKNKIMFTCELKKDINRMVEYHKQIIEELSPHDSLCIIKEVSYKFLEIGLIKVVMTYELLYHSIS
jgi:hypothetical protein